MDDKAAAAAEAASSSGRGEGGPHSPSPDPTGHTPPLVAEGVGPTQREEVGVLCLAAAQGRCDVINVRGCVGVLCCGVCVG